MTGRDPVFVVGAGASGVHFAAKALELGRQVVMLDVGFEPAEPVAPTASLVELRRQLPDPVSYFLGDDFRALTLPADSDEYYGFPPNKSYVFQRPMHAAEVNSTGFAPLVSFAAGGLAEAWTGGAYPFNAGETEAFPFDWNVLAKAYGEVAERIGVSGVVDDDLARFFPVHGGLQAPTELDAHSRQLLTTYENKRARAGGAHGLFMGRSRTAALSTPVGNRQGCTRCGRCLWGCPNGAFYTPRQTLLECRLNPNFRYISGAYVRHFNFDDSNRVTDVVAETLDEKEARFDVGTLVLAAGALGSGRIVLESLLRMNHAAELNGLMDNRQVHMPFVNLARLGLRYDDRAYQYHQLAVGAPGEHPFDYVHGLITTLTTGLIHPIAQGLPLGMGAATSVVRNLRASLGLMNINFADTRREQNALSLDKGADGRNRLLVHYTPPIGEAERVRVMIKRFRAFLMELGCIAPPNMTRLRPMGASVHYAGTLPMLAVGGDLTTEPNGRCRPFENLWVADGSTFPSLPAKNLTFTLMANATRIAREAFAD